MKINRNRRGKALQQRQKQEEKASALDIYGIFILFRKLMSFVLSF